jgi:hypothetical protein
MLEVNKTFHYHNHYKISGKDQLWIVLADTFCNIVSISLFDLQKKYKV